MTSVPAERKALPRTYWLCACGRLCNGRWVRCMRCGAPRPLERLRLVPAT